MEKVRFGQASFSGENAHDPASARQLPAFSPHFSRIDELLKQLPAVFTNHCGEGEIRTHGGSNPTSHFKCGALNHSATSPVGLLYYFSWTTSTLYFREMKR